jgi:hypothetical protein
MRTTEFPQIGDPVGHAFTRSSSPNRDYEEGRAAKSLCCFSRAQDLSTLLDHPLQRWIAIAKRAQGHAGSSQAPSA